MMSTVSILLLALCVSIFFLFNVYKRKNPKKTAGPLPPGPKGLPLIGNLHEFDPLHPHVHLQELANKYGPLMYMKFGLRPTIVISSARIAKLALKNNDLALSGRPQLVNFQKYSYKGNDITLSSYNDTWREMRKLSLLHLFSVKQVVSFSPIRRDEVSRMIGAMIKKSESSDRVINLSHAAFFLTNSIICRIGFGNKYDDKGDRRFDDLMRETQHLSAAFFFGDYFPFLSWVDKLTGTGSRLEKNFRELDKFYDELISDHLDPNRPDSMKGDILDLMLNLKQENAASVPIEWDNVKGILMNVFVAGTETSASLIVWAMTTLIKKPQAMKRAQEEVRNVVGKKGTVDDDDIQNLPYLKAIIKETLRLFPPTPLGIPRETIEKCTIDGYEIPPKTTVYVNVHAIGRDPEYWENPDEFIPERFLDSTIDFRGHDFGLIPFGTGRRGCPGLNLGIATVELALANLLYIFDWELPDGMKKEEIDMEIFQGVTSRKKNDLCLVGKRYEYNN